MKNLITLSLALFTVAAISAQWKRVKGNGNVVTIERSVGEYDYVSLAGWFDVELIDGKEGELTLTGEENLLKYIETEVKDGKLTIKKERGVTLRPSNWKNSILVKVPVESIEGASLSGSGDVVGKTTLKAERFRTGISGSGDIVLDVEANDLKASMSGSGDITLSGRATNFEVSVSGSGDIKAYDLEADFVDAQVSGSADIKVTANQALKARVSGSGDISYKGNPKKIETKSSGSGDITSY